MVRNEATWATIEEVLNHAREDHKTGTKNFKCCVEIKRIRANKDWFRLTCEGGKCMKGVTRINGKLWCEGCEKGVRAPQASFRLELDVFDATAETVVVFFDDTAKYLTNTTAQAILNAESGISRLYSVYTTSIQDTYTPVMFKNSDGSISVLPNCLASLVGTTHSIQMNTSTYYDHGFYESFNCNQLLTNAADDESVDSSYPITRILKCKDLTPITTPNKRDEAIENKRHIYEDYSDSEVTINSYPTEESKFTLKRKAIRSWEWVAVDEKTGHHMH